MKRYEGTPSKHSSEITGFKKIEVENDVLLVRSLIDSTLMGSANHADFIFSPITLEETLKRAR